MTLLLRGAHVVTMDGDGTEHDDGWVLVDGGSVAGVGSGAPPEADSQVDLGGAVMTAGLVNTHHHLYQTLTRARAQEADLFTWLKTLYPVWARLDAEAVYAAARTGLAELALSGCSTVFDHHYVFPRGENGLVEAEVQAARELGWSGATPFLTLSFLALSVIPSLKITDRGLVDVDRFEIVPLRV